MSEQTANGDELTKMKLGDLKKLCKKHNLSTAGTKVELISRLVETNNDTFTILQPGDEDKLLGEVDEPSSFELSVPTTPSIPPTVQKPTELVTEVVAPATPPVTISAGSKRTAAIADLQDPTAAVKQAEKPLVTAPVSDTERLAARANRFGTTTRPAGLGSLSDDKLAARARRFGLPVSEDGTQSGLRGRLNPSTEPPSEDEAEKRRKRAERFGLPDVNAMTEAQRKALRSERFGTAQNASAEKSDEQAKAARALKFGLATDEEKLQQRKARFGVA